MSSVVLIDNGGANLASLRHAFARLGANIRESSDPAVIGGADRVVLPGVGAAGDGMRRLRAAGLEKVVPALKQPVLGICLGMHLLYRHSEENATACLGVLPDTVSRLPEGEGIRVPHMGWNRLRDIRHHPLFDGVDAADWFYFVHAYAAPASAVTLASAVNGTAFAAAAGQENFVAVQFHPERSADAGARVLGNFLEWDGCS